MRDDRMVKAMTAPTLSTHAEFFCYDVRVFGDFAVSCDGLVLDVATWPRRGRSLLRLLAASPEHRRLRDEVIELLWPEATPQAGFANLRSVLHRVRRTIDPRLPPPLALTPGWIALNPACRWQIDLDRFEELVQCAGDDVEILGNAAALGAEEVLAEDRYEDWAAAVREQVVRQWRGTCLHLARLYRVWGSREEAIAWFEQILDRDPLDEEALQGLLGAMGEAGLGSEAVRRYQQFARRLREELEAEPDAGTVALASQINRGEQEVAIQHALLMAPARPLPAAPTPFIGREQETRTITEMLRRPEVRLLTLTGAGGIGKTRLAVQVASQLLDEYVGGAHFVSLAPVRDHGLIPSALAAALGVREAGETPLLTTIIQYLRDKQTLLLVDNLEHLLDGVTVLSDILNGCPRVTMLVTSRAVLRLAHEHIYEVPPLALPGGPHLPPLEALVTYDAVALFLTRAQAGDARFVLAYENAAAVTEICRRLDGLPLAIELAAARLRVCPPQELLERLSETLPLLIEGPRDAVARHRTLHAAIDWSYTLLDQTGKALFARLAVFAGGWTVEAAKAVCTAEEDRDIDVPAGLGSLADKHLVTVEKRPEGEPRFGMLETIREYAGEQLTERGEEEGSRAAHAAYFTALAEEAEPQLTGPEQAVWLDRLEQEHDNLRAALRWTFQSEVALGLRLAGALWRFWYVRGHATEARSWLEAMLAAGQELAVDGAARAKALKGAGALATQQGDYERARELHEASLQLSRELGNRDGIASALHNLSIVAWLQGDFERATELQEENLRLRRALGDINGIAGSLHSLGVVAKLRGDYDRAADWQEESLRLYRELGDKDGIARSLHNLGSLALQRADNERAKGLFEEVLQLTRELGDQNGIAGTLESLGIVAQRQGDDERAMELYGESLRILQQLGNKDGMACVLVNIAAVAESRQAHERAARLLGAADTTWSSLGTAPDHLHQQTVEDVSLAARKALGSEAYDAAWQQGQIMILEQAVADALDERQ